MPVTPTYPGVYIEEIPSGVRTIVGVATSITAFIGRALRGPTDTAVTINNFGDFERIFGGLWVESSLGFPVRDFYLNGGSQAVIVRLFHASLSEADQTNAEDAAKAVAAAATGSDAAAAALAARTKANTYSNEPEKTAADKVATAAETASTKTDATPASVQAAANEAVAGAAPASKTKLTVGDLPFVAAYEGKWGANLRVIVDPFVEKAVAERMGLGEDDLFNLTVRDATPGGPTERFLNLSIKPSARRIDRVLESESKLIRWYGDWPQPGDLPELAKLAAAQSAKKTLAEEQKKLANMPSNDPNRPAQKTKVDQAKKALETALNELVDPVTKAERALANAKKAIPQVPADITAAETALSKAIKSMQDAVSDGDDLVKADDFTPNGALDEKKGLYALEQLFARDGLFNILCIPPYGEAAEERVSLVSDAAAYCEKRRAMLIVDPPEDWNDKSSARDKFTDPNNDNVGTRSRNAALFFPRLRQPNPLHENQIEEFVPCGVVAGIFARTDTQRGVWKAPAGLDATLVGVPQLGVSLTDEENGELNPLGINCLRAFPVAGRVVWGSRTLRGADQLADEYKYIPVRRLALYIEESLYRGTQWVVFEPNDEPLWAQIRLNVGAFMHNLFRQGAFQGRTPRDAYLVKCDKETTTQNDINLGIVNIVVGFAPLKPAEFVIIKIQQLAGQIEV